MHSISDICRLDINPHLPVMKKLYSFCLSVLTLLLVSAHVFSQETASPVTISSSFQRLNDKEVMLTIKAQVKENAKLYSAKKLPNDAPASEITFDSSVVKLLSGELTESGNVKKEVEPTLQMEVAYSTDSVIWQQKINLAAGDSAVIEGKANCFVQLGDSFEPKEEEFTIVIPPAAIAATAENTSSATATATGEQESEKSLWEIFLQGFGAGLLAFIMPCIYAMVPVTVSFFTKRSKTKKEGIKNAFIYSGSIITIFTLIGFLITIIFGQGALNELASSAVFNVSVFILFMIFGISFLGAFELTLPSSWSNKVDAKAGLNSYSGIFFLALTLVIVSFSCTVPFIGGLTVLISKGSYWAPFVGFFAFSLALSLPFAIFTVFPSLLNKMGKSGGWLNSVKVVLGFVELALALKFLSSADLAYHWRLLDREVYLALWIAIFGLLGIYLLGKLKFKHDDDLPRNDYGHPYLTVTRLFFAIAALSFTVYLIPGMWGAPLNGISAWLPETKTQDFNLSKGIVGAAPSSLGSDIRPVKYTDLLESEVPGVEAFFDYEEALVAAKKVNKPVMIDFTGHSCANCRKMEKEVLNNPEVMKRLQTDFVVVSLYVDDKFKLPSGEWYTSKIDGSKIKTMGAKNLDFEVTLTNTNAQPLYVFVDPNGKIIKNAGGYNSNIPRFINILEEVKKSFKK